MPYKYVKRYKIMNISEDGLLKTPRNSWGDKIFDYEYQTEEEAMKAISTASDNHRDGVSGDFVIMTVASEKWNG